MALQLYLTPSLFKAIKPKAKSKVIKNEAHGWRGITVTSDQLLDEDLDLIFDTIESDTGGKDEDENPRPPLKDDIKNRRIIKSIKALRKLKASDPNEAKLKNLDVIPDAIREVMKDTPNKWVYKPNPDYGYMMPWFVKGVVYHPPEKRGRDTIPAHTTMRLCAFVRGEKQEQTYTWYQHNLRGGGKTVHELFADLNILIETEEVNKEYQSDLDDYAKWAPLLGEQFLGTGDAVSAGGSSWSRSKLQLEVDGVKAKLIMDSTDSEKDEPNIVKSFFWSGNIGVDEEEIEVEDDDEDPNAYMAPMHPICRLFHLENHEFILCYVGCLTPYVYDAELINKLVLPEGNKELIDALTMSVVDRMEDIVAGKATGVMILCSGVPGTGKTLTSEVYAEAAKRPLYSVQCSQLGIKAEEIEKHLVLVLKRAVRWRAILLIDEADVYIHERGKNINQNSIVGTFLRALEYFAGIMFLTTNRATIVDDAIMSRMTAHVKYEVPKGDQRNRIWEVLSANFDIKMSKKLIEEAVAEWPNISGRSIRQMLRLAKFMADHRGEPVTIESLASAAKFHDFDEAKDAEVQA